MLAEISVESVLDSFFLGETEWEIYLLITILLFGICCVADIWRLERRARKEMFLDTIRWYRKFRTTQAYQEAKDRNKRDKHLRLATRRANSRKA